MDLESLKALHSTMQSAKKYFFDGLAEYEKEHGKAIVGSLIKSTCNKYRNRKFIVFEVCPAMSAFCDSFDIKTYYRATLLDGNGKKVSCKVVKFSNYEFDVIERAPCSNTK